MGCCGSKKYEMNEEISKGGLNLEPVDDPQPDDPQPAYGLFG